MIAGLNPGIPNLAMATLRMWAAASWGESVRKRIPTSAASTVLEPRSWERRKSSIGAQNSEPTRTIGKFLILPVWTSVAVSKISSRVPKPPGMAM
jgi:hypothetical protein